MSCSKDKGDRELITARLDNDRLINDLNKIMEENN